MTPSKPPFLIMAMVIPISNVMIAAIDFLLFIISFIFILFLHKKRGVA